MSDNAPVDLRFRYRSHRAHSFLATLVPKSYGRFLVTRLLGYLVWLIVLAFAFVVCAAFASGRWDQAVSLLLALGVIVGVVYEKFAARPSNILIFGFTLQPKPLSAAQTPMILILLVTAGWLLHKGLSGVPL